MPRDAYLVVKDVVQQARLFLRSETVLLERFPALAGIRTTTRFIASSETSPFTLMSSTNTARNTNVMWHRLGRTQFH